MEAGCEESLRGVSGGHHEGHQCFYLLQTSVRVTYAHKKDGGEETKGREREKGRYLMLVLVHLMIISAGQHPTNIKITKYIKT